MSTVKLIVNDMLVGLRLDCNNYDSWHCKIKYLLCESDSIDFMSQEVAPPRRDSAAEMQRHSDKIKKDQSARYLMSLCMAYDIFINSKI